MPRISRPVVFLSVAAFLVLSAAASWWCQGGHDPAGQPATPAAPQGPGYAGSASCRECHEKFYQLWASSHHGLAMQPVTPEFLRTRVAPQDGDLCIGDFRYRVEFRDGAAAVVENGPAGAKRFPLVHALGGKNVYYFLTPLNQGRLQVLPLAYDIRKKQWYDTTASMVRHVGGRRTDPVSWLDPLLTFNTACYGCHVSQLSTNYDPATGAYHTVWAEPGINCETCHGPAAEHVQVCRAAPKGAPPPGLKIISAKKFTVAQHNDTCSACHAKLAPLTPSYTPGERYFDHFDLTTLEDPDFYPDGRDLGENFTLTLWLTSPCVKSGQLSCLHCHTSSGRYRFPGPGQANRACLPCHGARVARAREHTHHPPDKPGTPTCVSCHMPMTEFARMRRTDHSMRPPTPAATLAFQSPNACNLCHQDKDAAWADRQVRRWHRPDYQKPLLYRAGLIDAARRRQWSRLPQILAHIAARDRDEVFATSLIRLLAPCPDSRKWPVLRQALRDPAPLVRGAAAAALEGPLTPETRDSLLAALSDPYRLVRLRAARSLAAYPRELLSTPDKQRLEEATGELLTALTARPDDWASHYNLGNFYLARGEPARAAAAFETAFRLQPETVLPLVNLALAQARLGQSEAAGKSLRLALQREPANAAANFNLGLLLAEQGDRPAAEAALRTALRTDPNLPEAAYNLGVLLTPDHLPEALEWLGRARELRPGAPKYAYTLAFYQHQAGRTPAAIAGLHRLVQDQPAYANAYLLLGGIYEQQGKPGQAEKLYRRALAQKELPPPARRLLESKLRSPASGKGPED